MTRSWKRVAGDRSRHNGEATRWTTALVGEPPPRIGERETALRDPSAFGVGMLPLLAGWVLALVFISRNGAAPVVLAIGCVATVSALLLGLPVWVWGYREGSADLCGRLGGARAGLALRPLLHAGAAVGFAALWVWLQYALNPYRVGPVGEAMLASHSLVWQALAGLWLYTATAARARVAGARARSVPEPDAEPATPLERIAIPRGERTVVVEADRIERLQAADDYVAVFADGRRLLASHRMSELAARLDGRWFLRVHRSHIVNLRYVEAFERADGGRIRLRMRSGATVPASRSGSALLRRRMRSVPGTRG